MATDIGEYFVGAYLRLVENCDFVDYNVRTPNGGRDGLNELDVLGIKIQTRVVYLCEVTTHICGLQYGKNYRDTVLRIRAKHAWQRAYAQQYLPDFTPRYQLWSPVVSPRVKTELARIENFEVVANGDYKNRVKELRGLARNETRNTQNPVFRVLQILEHLRDE